MPQDSVTDLFSKTVLCQTCSDIVGAVHTIYDQVHGVSRQLAVMIKVSDEGTESPKPGCIGLFDPVWVIQRLKE